MGSIARRPSGASFAKDSKVSNPAKTFDLKDVQCFKCHQVFGLMQREKTERAISTCGSSRPSNENKDDKKAIRLIRIRH